MNETFLHICQETHLCNPSSTAVPQIYINPHEFDYANPLVPSSPYHKLTLAVDKFAKWHTSEKLSLNTIMEVKSEFSPENLADQLEIVIRRTL